jgi:hypothetical protein
LFGLMYWYGVLPFHGVVFRGMLAGIQRDAVQIAALQSPDIQSPDEVSVPPYTI